MQTATLIITSNEYNTLFVEMDGALLADSCVFNRKRGFHNKATGEWTYAPSFTPRKVRKNPEMVLDMLEKTGTIACASVVIKF